MFFRTAAYFFTDELFLIRILCSYSLPVCKVTVQSTRGKGLGAGGALHGRFGVRARVGYREISIRGVVSSERCTWSISLKYEI